MLLALRNVQIENLHINRDCGEPLSRNDSGRRSSHCSACAILIQIRTDGGVSYGNKLFKDQNVGMLPAIREDLWKAAGA